MREWTLLDSVSRQLWEERHVVTYLLYKLTLSRLQLAADAGEDLAATIEEVDVEIAGLRSQEGRREAAVRDLAHEWQVDPAELMLAELARRSPPPFDVMFREHSAAFGELAAEIEEVAAGNRVSARARGQDVAEALKMLSGIDGLRVPTYDATGNVEDAALGRGRLREVM